MKAPAALLVAAVALAGARVAKSGARELSGGDAAPSPYAPRPSTAPLLALGYRELAADLLYVRLVGYWGGLDNDADKVAALTEAVAALDPRFRRNYEFGAVAMTAARRGVGNAVRLRAIALLRRAMEMYPTHWRYPKLAGEIYLIDLETADPAQRRAWDEQGALLLETASRKPDAPAGSGISAAVLQSRLGQYERAVASLQEMLLLTSDDKARARILDELAKLTEADSDEIAAEISESRRQFDQAWLRERPAVSPSMYILIGPRLAPGFDLADLATGGRDLVGTEAFERLEPLYDEPATSADGPSSP